MTEEKYDFYIINIKKGAILILLGQKVTVTWQNRNKKHFIEKGYTFTKNNDKFEVNVLDLPLTNKSMVKVICDYCGKEIEKSYCDYHVQHNKYGDCCKECSKHKLEKVLKEKYGVNWYTQTDSFKEKSEKTMQEKFGVNHALQSQIIQNKFQETSLKNNGTKYPMESLAVKNKREENCLEKYGVKNTLSDNKIRKKIEETCLKKYGVHTTALVPEIREKQRESLYKNSTIASSKPEQETIQLLKEIYGEDKCIAQFPTKYYNLDCLLTINDIKIDIEYDGQWCHNESFDKRRDSYHINHGYKVLRIKGNHKIPTKEQIILAINNLLKENNIYAQIDL